MLNKIKWNGLLLEEVIREGRKRFYILENGLRLDANTFRKDRVEIQCHGNNKWYLRGLQTCWLEDKIYYSNEYLAAGKNNPFYGKTHSKEFSKKHSKRMSEKYQGSGNPFYGKHHSDKTRERLRQTTTEFMNSERGKEICRKGGIAAVSKRPKKTKIERIVEDELSKMNVNFKYNFILDGKYQYDFLIGDDIILEVHGDYWHANPRIYGEGLKPLSERQLFKIERDKIKKEYALSKNYKILYIWESEIYNENFKLLENIKKT